VDWLTVYDLLTGPYLELRDGRVVWHGTLSITDISESMPSIVRLLTHQTALYSMYTDRWRVDDMTGHCV